MVEANERQSGAGGGARVMSALEVKSAVTDGEAGHQGDDDQARVVEAAIKACATPVAYICMGTRDVASRARRVHALRNTATGARCT